MIYSGPDDWRAAPNKRVLFFGMSGLGKTRLSSLLRQGGEWFHYSIDYRIGTRYMGEYITDNAKREAMKSPLLRELLMTDSIYIGSNITFDNLAPLSTYLGKPGDPAKGGLPLDEYLRRQAQHRYAEIQALLDTGHFIERAMDLYGYPHFVCDSGGSICEVVDPDDPEDPVLRHLAENVLMVWIEGSVSHQESLVARFDKAPKPMYYQPEFLGEAWQGYLTKSRVEEGSIDPDAFIRWTFSRALARRQPLYRAMARNWGVTVKADDVARVRTAADAVDLVARAIGDAPAAR